jgi:hypothetical protein
VADINDVHPPDSTETIDTDKGFTMDMNGVKQFQFPESGAINDTTW